LGCKSFSELYFKATSDPSKTISRKIIDSITTHETLFFRDASPFEMLQFKILPDLIDKKTKGASGAPPVPRGRKYTASPSS
jgi:chemotaxis protein methyltransferase CheR